ncbi:hypothetical protein SAMD00019534_048910 [Acytostelium subglobosum LB1]|uniref:hypothetical protein n=1 Tax=Acytostelium subglobosum LB1 TaxID=1410327 RepID=UPI000644A3FA|nr:hypothetical protein SAMD00019534_048910 [Acytostelium subglobosum LB1]GAM21716.1 hypothetical protein SAMD00019534_048910 [Acytostelium subglobosum LB1]|eukprot:XP_012755835.1 hypothetical protein SAMD00019534_048910 [Acytostelium subglobosum LB1]
MYVFYLFFIVAVVAFKLYFGNEMKRKSDTVKEIDLSERVVIITGANAGLGKEIALRLARRGAHIIMACRTESKANQAIQELIKATGNTKIEFMQLDLLSLDSVVSFAAAFRQRSLPCHILVNNAGIMWLTEDSVNQPPLTTQPDNSVFNTQFLANYIGHLLLTLSLFDILMKSSSSILNVSSSVHNLSSLNLDNLTGNHSQTFITYCQSKLCQIYNTYELQRRIDQYSADHPEEPKCVVNAVHPGIFASEIVSLPWPLKGLYHTVFKSAAYCSEYIVECLVSQQLQGIGGRYFDHGRQTKSSRASYDTAVSSQLFQRTIELISTRLPSNCNPLSPSGSWL